MIWEPVLATDFVAPSTAALARIADARAEQYWDRKRALSHLLGERNRSTVVWDHIAVYAPGTLWQDAPPNPIYSDNPVLDVIGGAKEYLSQRDIKFQERDIAQDPSALADLKKLGYMTTPVIVIDGAVIVGFDSAKIDKHTAD